MEVRVLTDSLSVPDLLARHPGRRGVGKLAALLAADAPEGISRNDFEEAFVALLDRYCLPCGRMNADRGGGRRGSPGINCATNRGRSRRT